jgi:multiple sugar transport system substrate-binding protein
MIELRGITWNHTRGYAPMAVTAQVFTDRRPDVSITWDRRSLWAFGEQSLDDLVAAYDLLVIDHPMIGWAARTGALVPLDEHLSPALMDQLRNGTVGSSQLSYRDGEHDYALAIDAACQVSVARPDLLESYGRGVPARWDDVLALARDTGRVALPLNSIDVFSAFVTLSAHLGSSPDPGAGPGAGHGGNGGGTRGGDGIAGFVRRETGMRVLAMLRELAGLVDEPCLTANPIAVLNRMATTDEVAYCPLLFGYTNYSRSGYAPRLLSFTNIPTVDGGPPAGACLGGAGIAVSARRLSSPAHLAAAVEYAGWVADPATQAGDFVRAGGQPAAAAAWDDPVANLLTGDFFASTRATIDASYLRPRHPGFPDFQTEAAGILREAVTGAADPQAALDAVDAAYLRSFATPTTSRPTT